MASTTRSTRSNNIFPFSSLTLEIVEHILFQLPETQLQPLLFVNRALNSLVKRVIFNEINLEIGFPTFKEKLLLECLKSMGNNVKTIRFSPTFNDRFDEDLSGEITPEELVQRLTPTVRGLTPSELNSILFKIIGSCLNVTSLQFEVYFHTRIESDTEGCQYEIVPVETEELDKVTNVLSSLTNLSSFTLGVSHPKKDLEILSNESFQSPYIRAISHWKDLTHLELWGNFIQIPTSISIPSPSYQLTSLSLSYCTFDSPQSLSFLIGDSSTPHLNHLDSLSLKEIEFISHPLSSSPLLSLFIPTCSFSNTLTSLSLHLRHPFSPTSSTTPKEIFTRLTNLKEIHLEGEGITLTTLLSLLPSSSAPRLTTPSSTLKSIILHGCTSLSLSSIAQFFRNSTTSSSSESNSNWTSLKHLDFYLPLLNPRKTPWSSMTSSIWSLTPTTHWREIIRWIKIFNLSRGKVGRGKGLKLFRNGVRVEEWEEESSDESEEGLEGDDDALYETEEEEEVRVEEEESDSD